MKQIIGIHFTRNFLQNFRNIGHNLKHCLNLSRILVWDYKGEISEVQATVSVSLFALHRNSMESRRKNWDFE